MKIYTRSGDLGETSLFGGRRVPKHHLRIEAYGTVDELNSTLGLAVSQCPEADLRLCMERVQAELFEVGADLATPLDARTTHVVRVTAASIDRLEQEIDAWQEMLPQLQSFILPGGSATGATLHIARTVCRRAERAITSLAEHEEIHPDPLRYLNRLSDWLFVLARLANHRQDKAETPWIPNL